MDIQTLIFLKNKPLFLFKNSILMFLSKLGDKKAEVLFASYAI